MTLLNSIIDVPRLLQQVDNDYSSIDENKLFQKRINKVIFVGSGSSNNAIEACRGFYEDECKLNLEVYFPNNFVNYKKVYDEALYVFVSQSGETKLVYQGVEKIKSLGFDTVCITENVNSSIAKISDCTIDLKTEIEEYLYRTIGYSNTVARCMQLAIKLSGKSYKKYSEDLQKAISNLSNLRKQTIEWFEVNKFELLKSDTFYFSGESYLFEVCKEADIKFMEMIPVVTRSFELEEFLHGPQNSFDYKMVYFLLIDKSLDENKVTQISKYLKDKFGKAYLIGDKRVDDKDICFEYCSSYFKQLEIITVFQTLGYLIASTKGRDLKTRLNKDIDKYITKML